MPNREEPLHVTEQLRLIDEAQAELDRVLMERMKIEMSDPYIALNREIDAANLKKALMTSHLEDERLRSSLQAAKLPLFAIMEREGREKVGKWQGKYKEAKAVNAKRLLPLLHGDLDRFLRMSKIAQVDLTAFAREEGGPREKELLDCIEVESRTLIDIVPIEAQR